MSRLCVNVVGKPRLINSLLAMHFGYYDPGFLELPMRLFEDCDLSLGGEQLIGNLYLPQNYQRSQAELNVAYVDVVVFDHSVSRDVLMEIEQFAFGAPGVIYINMDGDEIFDNKVRPFLSERTVISVESSDFSQDFLYEVRKVADCRVGVSRGPSSAAFFDNGLNNAGNNDYMPDEDEVSLSSVSLSS